MYILELSDKIAQKLSPILAGGIFIGSVYWTAVTYGAVTVMQVCNEFLPELIYQKIYQVEI